MGARCGLLPGMDNDDGRDPDFGKRVRAARAYTGLSQAGLAAEITARYPRNSVSASTIKRLESGDSSVQGSQREWTVWVADATGTPDWFLEQGWPDDPVSPQLRSREAQALETLLSEARVERQLEVAELSAPIYARLQEMEEQIASHRQQEERARAQRARLRGPQYDFSPEAAQRILFLVRKMAAGEGANPGERATFIRDMAAGLVEPERGYPTERDQPFYDQLMDMAAAYESRLTEPEITERIEKLWAAPGRRGRKEV